MDDVVLGMSLGEARALWHSICTTVELMDAVDDIPVRAPLYGQYDRLVGLARRLDHEINCVPAAAARRKGASSA